jgi:hypothetical protein
MGGNNAARDAADEVDSAHAKLARAMRTWAADPTPENEQAMDNAYGAAAEAASSLRKLHASHWVANSRSSRS